MAAPYAIVFERLCWGVWRALLRAVLRLGKSRVRCLCTTPQTVISPAQSLAVDVRKFAHAAAVLRPCARTHNCPPLPAGHGCMLLRLLLGVLVISLATASSTRDKYLQAGSDALHTYSSVHSSCDTCKRITRALAAAVHLLQSKQPQAVCELQASGTGACIRKYKRDNQGCRADPKCQVCAVLLAAKLAATVCATDPHARRSQRLARARRASDREAARPARRRMAACQATTAPLGCRCEVCSRELCVLAGVQAGL